jgi:hypothetical protein
VCIPTLLYVCFKCKELQEGEIFGGISFNCEMNAVKMKGLVPKIAAGKATRD